MPVQWTEGRIYKLVRSYERQECLWRHDCDAFNDTEARYDAYLNILRDMNVTDLNVNEIRDMIKQVRRVYRLELNKINDAVGRGYPYKPRIVWFDTVHEFLCSYISDEEPQTDSLLNVEVADSDPEEFGRYIPSPCCPQPRYNLRRQASCRHYLPIPPSLDTCPTKLVNNAVSSAQVQQHPASQPTIMPSQHFNVQQSKAPAVHDVDRSPRSGDCSPTRILDPQVHMPPVQISSRIATFPKKHRSQRKSEDEFDAFGKSVACQLRQLALSHALRTQTKIQSLLAEERITLNQEKEKNKLKKEEHRHRHRDRGGSRVTQSSRSSRSSFNCNNSNFQCPSASDLSSSRTPSHSRRNKSRDVRNTCNLDDSASKSHHRTCYNKT